MIPLLAFWSLLLLTALSHVDDIHIDLCRSAALYTDDGLYMPVNKRPLSGQRWLFLHLVDGRLGVTYSDRDEPPFDALDRTLYGLRYNNDRARSAYRTDPAIAIRHIDRLFPNFQDLHPERRRDEKPLEVLEHERRVRWLTVNRHCLVRDHFAWQDAIRPHDQFVLIVNAYPAIALLALLLMLAAARRAIRARKRRSQGCCEDCGYDLRGAPGATCPECGRNRMDERNN